MDIGARALRLEEGGGGAARIEAALQMHREYRVEILRTHFVEEHVAQVSGIVHHCVDAAETIDRGPDHRAGRSEEHTSELQSLMRISYAVFCLKKKQNTSSIN